MNEQHPDDCGCQEYNELSRRQFITTSAVGASAAFFPAWLPRIVMSKAFASDRDIIVSVCSMKGAQ